MRATNEWPYNKCVNIGVIMLQMCVCLCLCGEMLSEPSSYIGRVCCLRCYECDGGGV